MLKKLTSVTGFLIWGSIVLSAFYITQHPLVFQVINGIMATIWSIALTIILLVNAAGAGYFILARTHSQLDPHERLIFGIGIGLGIFGLTGYGLGAAGLATPLILTGILLFVLISIFIFKIHKRIHADLQDFANSFWESRKDISSWIPFAVLATSLTSFLFALLPPADGFDGLSYHLRLPELLLADGRILPHNILQFWFPSLVEGDFLWALGLGSERTTQLIHWSFLILTFALVWKWSHQVFGSRPAWWALAILTSMPSLAWLSAWAYTDMALTFFGLACLYAIWRWSDIKGNLWLLISSLFAGMAMGIKYTSFIFPLLCVFIILLSEKKMMTRVTSSVYFSLPALIVASPWYLRNWLIMGNPVYPSVFKGRYWDIFRTNWYNGTGTGVGWNLREILFMPFTITMGYRDQNFFDGRIGPLFLLLLPLTVWIIWVNRSAPKKERNTLLILSAFMGLCYLFWVFGVTQTIYLWQSRLLFPGLIPFAIPIGLGLANLDRLNLPQFRISFIINAIVGLVIGMTLLDNGLSLITRRPITYALGMESRNDYFEHIQPNYAEALQLAEETPDNAYIYFLYEPRSYNMPRKVQPDPILDNLMHDYYLYSTTEQVLKNWQSNGYTYILIYSPGLQHMQQSGKGIAKERFNQLLKYLTPVKKLDTYQLYAIPQN